MKYALEHNLTDEAVISEMMKFGKELQDMIDDHKKNGYTTEYDL